MPRLTLLRAVLLLPVLTTALVILWFALPFSPPQTLSDKQNYVNRILQRGASLTTVHREGITFRSDTWLGPDDSQPGRRGWWSAVILEWQLEQPTPNGNIMLKIGTPTNTAHPDLGARIDLTKLAHDEPQFVPEGLLMWTSAGDQDGFSLPYFDYADATLFYHQVEQSEQLVNLRILVSEPGVVQIWKDMPNWNSFNASHISLIDDDDRRNGLVATFSVTVPSNSQQQPSLKAVKVSIFDMLLPSRTYPIRKLILRLLVPMYYGAVTFAEATFKILWTAVQASFWIAVVYSTLVFICWCFSGRTEPFETWSKHFWLTKHLSCKVFGPPEPQVWSVLGPLDRDEEEHKPQRLAKPLTSPWAFFTSSSPLDDLLVTFAATRWMVQPAWPKTKRKTSPLLKVTDERVWQSYRSKV